MDNDEYGWILDSQEFFWKSFVSDRVSTYPMFDQKPPRGVARQNKNYSIPAARHHPLTCDTLAFSCYNNGAGRQ